jgi:hypothetical protein
MIGDSAGRQSMASYNTMVGRRSGEGTTTGTANTFLGADAARSNTTGSYNVAIGYFNLDDNGAATGNTALGYSAATLYTNGNYNTFIGYDADASSANLTNGSAFGKGSRITASNQVRIGNSAVSSIGGYAGWSNISDGRYKKNVQENIPGLDFIIKLRPVSYNLDIKGIDGFVSGNVRDENFSEEDKAATAQASNEKQQITYTGFIAQEVEKTAKEIGYDFSGVDAPKNENDLYGLRYAEFVVPLVKAVQEQQVIINEQDTVIGKQKDQIEELYSRIEKLEGLFSESQNSMGEKINSQSVELSGARLEQNIPNPFSQVTVINYFIPDNTSDSKINFYSERGDLIKTVSINEKGYGQITVNASDLAAGVYQYSLIVNGIQAATRQLMIAK